MEIRFGNSSINLNQALSTNYSYSGIITENATVASNSLGVGTALYLTSIGEYEEANANLETTMPCRGLTLETGTGEKKVLLLGFLRNDSWNFTIGKTIYINDVNGGLVESPPSGANYEIQPIGYSVNSTIIYFNPSLFVMTTTI